MEETNPRKKSIISNNVWKEGGGVRNWPCLFFWQWPKTNFHYTNPFKSDLKTDLYRIFILVVKYKNLKQYKILNIGRNILKEKKKKNSFLPWKILKGSAMTIRHSFWFLLLFGYEEEQGQGYTWRTMSPLTNFSLNKNV